MRFKTYLNHPINQKTVQKKPPKGNHSSQKRGGGPARYDHDHRFIGFFLKPSLNNSGLMNTGYNGTKVEQSCFM